MYSTSHPACNNLLWYYWISYSSYSLFFYIWFIPQTKFILLYRIKLLRLLMDTHCVLCEVRAAVLYACLCYMWMPVRLSLSRNIISLATLVEYFLLFAFYFEARVRRFAHVCKFRHVPRLSACISRALTGRINVETDVAEFHEDLSRNSKNYYNRAKLCGVLREASSKFHYCQRN